MHGDVHLWRLAATTLLAAVSLSSGWAQVPDWSQAARQRLTGVGDAQMAQRLALLDSGERQLAAGDAIAAQASLDRAAMLLHAPDTEATLVRSYMQAGEYRRALAFGAHAAGAHRREWPAGQALYVWLLQVGGQGVVARRMLDEALTLAPGDAALTEARAQLSSAWPVADGVLRSRPLIVAPYAVGTSVAEGARVAGSALLFAGGGSAVVPTALLGAAATGSGTVWLRNGLGQTVVAQVDRRDEDLGLTLLRLPTPLPTAELPWAPREPYGGSPGSMVEYAAQADADAAWPLLRQGFFARTSDASALRPLGIEAPVGPRGGPVFDAAGQLAGVAVTADDGVNRLVPLARLADRFGLSRPHAEAGSPTAATAGAAGVRADVDAVYERSLRAALQVLVAP